ncbi:Spo0B domain-containing protein [Paenibacillus daejeonensis]|uniref:Spo0B domain-containing protein n=1 Tax=Paenibacillus daejeonensis TaxID=135193 RepID=UPI0003630D70|nr:GHKL domain-containing protein [Paenibacillus daejeonensis]
MEYVLATLNILIFISIPQTFIHTWLACLIWGIRMSRMVPRLLLFTVVTAALFDIAFLALPTHLHMINANIIYFLVMLLMFRELKLSHRILIQVTMSSTIILSDSLLVLLDIYLSNGLIEQIKTGAFIYKVIWIWPALLAFGLICLLMHRKQFAPAERVLHYIQRQRRPYIFLFILLIFLQLSMLVLYMSTRFLNGNDNHLMIVYYLGLITITAVSITSIWLLVKTRDDAIRSTQQAYVGDLLQMITTIRGQRHDFINHVQVMYSLLKMKKHDQLSSYMEEVVDQIQMVSSMSRQIPTPALSALVQAKSAIALDKKIAFECECTDLPEELPLVKSVDLVRIIGNLIDNAFDAVFELPEDERYVKLTIQVAQGRLTIRLANSGFLTERERRHMFKPGFTTKHEEHSGLGLAIVSDLVKHYGGKIEVETSASNPIVFQVTLPMEARSA